MLRIREETVREGMEASVERETRREFNTYFWGACYCADRESVFSKCKTCGGTQQPIGHATETLMKSKGYRWTVKKSLLGKDLDKWGWFKGKEFIRRGVERHVG